MCKRRGEGRVGGRQPSGRWPGSSVRTGLGWAHSHAPGRGELILHMPDWGRWGKLRLAWVDARSRGQVVTVATSNGYRHLHWLYPAHHIIAQNSCHSACKSLGTCMEAGTETNGPLADDRAYRTRLSDAHWRPQNSICPSHWTDFSNWAAKPLVVVNLVSSVRQRPRRVLPMHMLT